MPAQLDDEVASEVERVSLASYRLLGCRGFGRVDIILDGEGTPWILELNTIPGLTETSLMPMAAEAAGISFEDLIDRVALSAFSEHEAAVEGPGLGDSAAVGQGPGGSEADVGPDFGEDAATD